MCENSRTYEMLLSSREDVPIWERLSVFYEMYGLGRKCDNWFV